MKIQSPEQFFYMKILTVDKTVSLNGDTQLPERFPYITRATMSASRCPLNRADRFYLLCPVRGFPFPPNVYLRPRDPTFLSPFCTPFNLVSLSFLSSLPLACGNFVPPLHFLPT